MLRDIRKSAYRYYLESPWWQARRQHKIEEAGGICERCQWALATEVHHLHYLRLYKELPTDLLAVCKDCHAELHGIKIVKGAANDNQIAFSFEMPEEKDDEEAA